MSRQKIFFLFFASMALPLRAEVQLGGFIPYVGIGLTDEFKNANTDLSGTFFLADPETTYAGLPLSGGGSPYYDLALLDTGAAAHFLTPKAHSPSGFDIDGNGFDGTNIQEIGGATGLLITEINDPLAIYAAGLSHRTAAGAALEMETTAFRGQSSVATLSAPAEWTLPNILGLPMAAQHAIHIKNSEPLIFEHENRTVRTPDVEFFDLGAGGDKGILRRTDLRLRPGSAFIAGPLYVQNLDILGGQPFHENPLSPTVVENGGIYLEVDMTNGSQGFQDKELLFDTGADLTVVSQLTAKRLGFDAVLDKPDFTLQVEGSGGVAGGVPGFYLDQLNIDTVGGSFTAEDVPIAVLDVTNPHDPGNTLDGILGMHLFNGRDLVIDANASVGQGGAGPSLYISDPVVETHTWTSTVSQPILLNPDNWSNSGTPNSLWVAEMHNTSVPEQFVGISSAEATFHQLTVGGTETTKLNLEITGPDATVLTFGAMKVETGGHVQLIDNGRLDAQFVNLEGGVLSGQGEIFVGTGPVHGTVRNLSGRIEPQHTMSIIGDLSNSQEGTLHFDLFGGTSEAQDKLVVDRIAFLGGILDVGFAGAFEPTVGETFTLISAGASTQQNGIEGEFDALLLPEGFFWSVDYRDDEVVLEVVGLGDLEGDFNRDGSVDNWDLMQLEFLYGNSELYTGNDFLKWQRNFGSSDGRGANVQVPEPSSMPLILLGFVLFRRYNSRR